MVLAAGAGDGLALAGFTSACFTSTGLASTVALGRGARGVSAATLAGSFWAEASGCAWASVLPGDAGVATTVKGAGAGAVADFRSLRSFSMAAGLAVRAGISDAGMVNGAEAAMLTAVVGAGCAAAAALSASFCDLMRYEMTESDTMAANKAMTTKPKRPIRPKMSPRASLGNIMLAKVCGSGFGSSSWVSACQGARGVWLDCSFKARKKSLF